MFDTAGGSLMPFSACQSYKATHILVYIKLDSFCEVCDFRAQSLSVIALL